MNPAEERPTLTDHDEDQDDPRLMEALREYQAALDAGRRPNKKDFLARYPEVAGDLADCLAGLDLLRSAAPRLQSQERPVMATLTPEGTLGDFRLVREIGRGGMGVVYEAVQLSLGRRVALKVLPFAAGLEERQLQRFRAEANAAAGLHHSNIVPVHAVGCDRGVHFYAMQLIDGRPLDAVIRAMRGESGLEKAGGGTTVEAAPSPTRTSQRSGRDREGFRGAARIAAQVADALEYAHEAGIVHRDIKPANLLLDGRGSPWVTDFGLAQVANANLTRTGDVVGTLRYMSPEQASGRRVLVDHRTDIYSLGATLYELLTLQPIFPAQDRAALLNQILNEEPRPLRQIDRSVPPELETIVLKAAAKAPEDRYASAKEMAADLRRFLDELPILARRPSLVDRGRKWLRRHPYFTTATVVLLAFATAVLAAAFGLVWREQSRTQAAYASERNRAREAEDRFRLAQRAVDDLIQVAQEELIDKPQTESLRKRMLESALAYYQEFVELAGDDPAARADLAASRDRVEEIVRELTARQGDKLSWLLNDAAVLDDLRLPDEQRSAVDALRRRLDEKRRDTLREFHRMDPQERERRFVEMARAIDAAVGEVLTPAQVRRLRQIELQRRGPEAFREPDVAATLKLTPAQRARVRAILADPLPGKPEARGQPRGITAEQRRKAAAEQIAKLLTAEQTEGWKKIAGEPFKGVPARPPARGGPPKGRKPDDGRRGAPPPWDGERTRR